MNPNKQEAGNRIMRLNKNTLSSVGSGCMQLLFVHVSYVETVSLTPEELALSMSSLFGLDFHPDTEASQKLTGSGPKSISKSMIDKLYKYNSNRKQFTVLPAKTVSVSVDALTIHNHLWQVKRIV